ncbi:MAG: DUF4169 family protein [Tateyamaria sp.]
MSTPINLNKVRKARARAEKKARADANAAAYGIPKSQRIHASRENARQTRELEGKVAKTTPYGANGDDKKP